MLSRGVRLLTIWLRFAAAAVVAALAIAVLAPALSLWSAPTAPIPDLITLRPGSFAYRAAGEYLRDARPVTAPLLAAGQTPGLSVMRQQVTEADYQRCVDAGGCVPVDGDASPDRPMVKVSFRDAEAYAAWLSRSTGLRFRLPSDREWAYAAGSRFSDDAVPEISEVTDPGRRALVLYDKGADRTDGSVKAAQPIGSFGANEHGLVDLAGNVWEWTTTCFERHSLTSATEAETVTANCGVRVVEGRHRAYIPDFIREPRAGGCSVGRPPSNLGFRLVRDD